MKNLCQHSALICIYIFNSRQKKKQKVKRLKTATFCRKRFIRSAFNICCCCFLCFDSPLRIQFKMFRAKKTGEKSSELVLCVVVRNKIHENILAKEKKAQQRNEKKNQELEKVYSELRQFNRIYFHDLGVKL